MYVSVLGEGGHPALSWSLLLSVHLYIYTYEYENAHVQRLYSSACSVFLEASPGAIDVDTALNAECGRESPVLGEGGHPAHVVVLLALAHVCRYTYSCICT